MPEIGQKVRVHYTGKFDDGTIFNSSIRRGEPLEMVLGKMEMPPAFEEAVCKLGMREETSIDIPASEAYGKYDESLVEAVPLDAFPHAEQLPVGRYIMLSNPIGDIRAKVVKIEDGMVYFDHNHELAGKNLHFDIKLIAVDHGSAIEDEKHADGCACGCGKLKQSLCGE